MRMPLWSQFWPHFWPQSWSLKPGARTAPVLKPEAAPALLDGPRQWSKVENVLTGAIASAEGVERLQSAAAAQIDATGYALRCLLAELSGVMTLPAPERTAAVVRLDALARLDVLARPASTRERMKSIAA